jgi:hypothetical protein
MSTCNYTQSISDQQCIGDSLVIINNNFATLDTSLCTTTTSLATLSSAEVILAARVAALIPGAAKAWVNFDATLNTYGAAISDGQNCLIRDSYNIASVYRVTTGEWIIYFTTPMSNNGYVVEASTRVSAYDGAYNSGYIVGIPSISPVSNYPTLTPYNSLVTTSSFKIQCMTAASQNYNDVGDLRDTTGIFVTVHGN